MSGFQLAFRSLVHFWRTNLVLTAGIAAATAVLTGALIVGDSMRASLRELALDRLGKIDEIIVADGFFRQQLATELQASPAFKSSYQAAEAGILFPNGSIETGSEFSGDLRRVANVNVLGVAHSFWRLGEFATATPAEMRGRQVIINQTLADQLNLSGTSADADQAPRLTLRILKPSQLPADSALGKKDGLAESLVDLQVVQIIADKSLGRFALRPSQIDSASIFVPIDLLADALSQGALSYKQNDQANVIFLSGIDQQPPDEMASQELLASLRPSIEDFGLSVKHILQPQPGSEEPAFEYFSLSSDRLVLTDSIVGAVNSALPAAQPVFTYLANDIRVQGQASGIPFSMITAIDVGDEFPLIDVDGHRIEPVAGDEIVLNQWSAADLDAEVGDTIEVTWFEPESTHGHGVEQSARFKSTAIAKLTEPDSPFQMRRRDVIPPEFSTAAPTLANDPNLTPEVPGLTDAASIERWDLPFDTAGKIRPADDDYWNNHRTTPKAFISMPRGQQLWSSRFGSVTNFRIPVGDRSVADIESKLLNRFIEFGSPPGFNIVPIKRNAIAASSGSTPFDALFLALSMFVIGAALILVSLLFRLTLQNRAVEIGTLLATGCRSATVSGILLIEMFAIALLGSLLGIALGVAYAAAMIFGLKTWWLGAISKPVLNLHLSVLTLGSGAVCGLLICFATIVLTIRGTRKTEVRQLLAGDLSRPTIGSPRTSFWTRLAIGLCLAAAAGLSLVAGFLGGEPQAGAFMGSGFLVLTAVLVVVYLYLKQDSGRGASVSTLAGLAAISGKRNPLRSTLTLGLVAVASFLIVAVSSFRLTPSEAGTGGFDLIGSSDQPIFEELAEATDLEIQTHSLRLKAGEDASCNNLYQSTQPQVIGVPASFIESFDSSSAEFRWASTVALDNAEKSNPWRLLRQQSDDGAIPVVIDKNTANYSLKIFAPGGDYSVTFDSGQTIVFRVVGFLENSILQGSLIIAEENFLRAFPEAAGYRLFLIAKRTDNQATLRGKDPNHERDVSLVSAALESRYSDQGFDAQSAPQLLAKYQQVQNTYISTFQTLGALGLLLGTLGLAAVQIRSVLERQQELGLLRAVGFSRNRLGWMVLWENAWLLAMGLGVGIGSALVTTLPHYFVGGASVPWLELAVLFVLILACGLVAAALASRIIARLPLVQSLRV